MARKIGTMHPTDGPALVPDQVTTFLMTGGSSAQAADWTTSTGGAAADAAEAGVHIVRLTGMTSAGAAFGFNANLKSTSATVPASGTSIASSGVNQPVVGGPVTVQIPGDSTGFSFAAFTSGYVIMEQYAK